MPRPLQRRWTFLLAVIPLFIVATACGSDSAPRDTGVIVDVDSGFLIPPPTRGFTPVQVVIAPPRDGRLAEVRDWVTSREVLPRVARLLESTLMLRSQISLEATECGVINASYHEEAGQAPRILLCYEMIDAVHAAMSSEDWYQFEDERRGRDVPPAWRTLQELAQDPVERRVLAVLTFILLHEVSHALESSFALSLGVESEFHADAMGFHVGWYLMELGTDFHLDVLEAVLVAPGEWLQYDVAIGDLHPSRVERAWRLACRISGVDSSVAASLLQRLGEPSLTASWCREFADRDARFYRAALGPVAAHRRRAIATVAADVRPHGAPEAQAPASGSGPFGSPPR